MAHIFLAAIMLQPAKPAAPAGFLLKPSEDFSRHVLQLAVRF